jgi:hypothetical protein
MHTLIYAHSHPLFDHLRVTTNPLRRNEITVHKKLWFLRGVHFSDIFNMRSGQHRIYPIPPIRKSHPPEKSLAPQPTHSTTPIQTTTAPRALVPKHPREHQPHRTPFTLSRPPTTYFHNNANSYDDSIVGYNQIAQETLGPLSVHMADLYNAVIAYCGPTPYYDCPIALNSLKSPNPHYNPDGYIYLMNGTMCSLYPTCLRKQYSRACTTYIQSSSPSPIFI